MDTTSEISSSTTKSKKSFISVFTKLFKRSKSTNSSKVKFRESIDDGEYGTEENLDLETEDGVVEEEEDDQDITNTTREPNSDIEILVTDIENEEWKPPKVVVQTHSDESHTDLDSIVKAAEEILTETDNKQIETVADVEPIKILQESDATEGDNLKNVVVYEQIGKTASEENVQLLPIQIDTRYAGQEFRDDQLPQFCEQLHNLLEVVRNVQGSNKMFRNYPRDLQQALENDAKELQLIYAEIRCIATTIDQVKKQRELVTNGKLEALDQLTILENEEFDEIEKSINIHDTPIYKSWEKTKRTKTPESFEKLIQDIHNNQEALKNLEILVKNRKAKLNYMNKRFRSVSGPVNETNSVIPANYTQSLSGSPPKALTN